MSCRRDEGMTRRFPQSKSPSCTDKVTLLFEVRLDRAVHGLLVRPSILYIMHFFSADLVSSSLLSEAGKISRPALTYASARQVRSLSEVFDVARSALDRALAV